MKHFILIVVIIGLFNTSVAFPSDLNQNLITASEEGDIGTVKALLAKGADANAKDKDGNTALIVASDMSHDEAKGTLVVQEAYLDTSAKGGERILSERVLSKATPAAVPDITYGEIIKTLIAQGADVNAKANNGVTALMRASWKGHGEIVKILIAQGANVNAKTNSGATALMMASRKGHIEIVKILLANSVDVNAKDNDGYTALTMASLKRNNEIVQLLKEVGAKEGEKVKIIFEDE